MDDKPPLYALLIVILAFGILTPLTGSHGLVEPSGSQTLGSNSYIGITNPAIPHIIVNGSLIDCLIFYESSGNPEAVGDDGKARGILQFWEGTFKMHCVDKYGLEDDIWNPEIQKICADKMIQDGYERSWTTLSKCK